MTTGFESTFICKYRPTSQWLENEASNKLTSQQNFQVRDVSGSPDCSHVIEFFSPKSIFAPSWLSSNRIGYFDHEHVILLSWTWKERTSQSQASFSKASTTHCARVWGWFQQTACSASTQPNPRVHKKLILALCGFDRRRRHVGQSLNNAEDGQRVTRWDKNGSSGELSCFINRLQLARMAGGDPRLERDATSPLTYYLGYNLVRNPKWRKYFLKKLICQNGN